MCSKQTNATTCSNFNNELCDDCFCEAAEAFQEQLDQKK